MQQLLSEFSCHFHMEMKFKYFSTIRARADDVLKRATEVSTALEDAELAQVSFYLAVSRNAQYYFYFLLTESSQRGNRQGQRRYFDCKV